MQKIRLGGIVGDLFKRSPVISDARTPEGIARDAVVQPGFVDRVKSLQKGLTENNIPDAVLLVTAIGVIAEIGAYFAHVSWAIFIVFVLPIAYLTQKRIDMNKFDVY